MGVSHGIERRKQHWLRCGKKVLEIDHGWIHSIYTDGASLDGVAAVDDVSDAD